MNNKRVRLMNIVCQVLGAVFMLTWLNYQFDWGVFGRFGRLAHGVSLLFVPLIIVLAIKLSRSADD